MATLIGSSGAGDDLIKKLHEMGVSRSCTTIREVMERRDAIDQAIKLERSRQEDLLEEEMKALKKNLQKSMLMDSILFFSKNKKSEEYRRRIKHLQINREAIIENNLAYLYREKDVLDRVTKEYRNELKGYYGELLVMDSLKQLSDDCYVISDVRITRESGYKFDGKMLKSARVDHILVCRKGVYCIETKNWTSSWKYEDKPTPGEQARRASHLLYKYLKYTCNLRGIKVMSIVLYTNGTIKGKEDFVRFLRYDEFPAYISARPEVLSDEEVNMIVDYIRYRDIRFDDSLKENHLKENGLKEDGPTEIEIDGNISGNW